MLSCWFCSTLSKNMMKKSFHTIYKNYVVNSHSNACSPILIYWKIYFRNTNFLSKTSISSENFLVFTFSFFFTSKTKVLLSTLIKFAYRIFVRLLYFTLLCNFFRWISTAQSIYAYQCFNKHYSFNSIFCYPLFPSVVFILNLNFQRPFRLPQVHKKFINLMCIHIKYKQVELF